MYSNVINLPFTFNFFGNSYNSLVVSTNGYIAFTEVPRTFSPWSFTTTIPNTTFPVKNAIFGCFHDLDNSNAQGTLTYGIYGTSPYRKFVLIFKVMWSKIVGDFSFYNDYITTSN